MLNFKHVWILVFVLVCTNSLQGVVQLTDHNFNQLVKSEPTFWIVLFAAQWCGHCSHLKPEFQKLAPRLAEYGVKLGHVNDKGNDKLIGQYVVDHKTHMVSYPKMYVFLGQQNMGDVPPGLRTANQIQRWFLNQFNLKESGQL